MKVSFKTFLILLVELVFLFFILVRGTHEVVKIIDGVIAQEKPIASIFMMGTIKQLWKVFEIKLHDEPILWWKIVLIFKALILGFFTLMISWHLLRQNLKENTVEQFLFIILKIIIIYIALFIGSAHILSSFESNSFFEYGKMFDLELVRQNIMPNKLAFLLVFGFSAWDLVVYHKSKSTAKPAQQAHE